MKPSVDGLINFAAAAAWLASGLALGALHFAALQRVCASFVAGSSPVVLMTRQAGRLALTGISLFVVVRLGGAFALLLATIGVQLARTAVLRGERST